ncbi:MAG: endolytic transglycosylase MltG [Oscillospiraceae bacterium]|nr:endolytic transglycosylase MltG [Oscillospiraceae bacterium]
MDKKENNEELELTPQTSFKIEFLSKDGDVISSEEETDLKPFVNVDSSPKPEEPKPKAANPYAPPKPARAPEEKKPEPPKPQPKVEKSFQWPEVSPLKPEPEKFTPRPSVYAQRAAEGKKLTQRTDSEKKERVVIPGTDIELSPNEKLRERPRTAKKTSAAPVEDEVPPVDPKAEKDFEVDFDYDEEYDGVDEKILKRGSGRRTGLVSGILYFIFVLCISVVLASFGWLWAQDVLGLGGDGSEVAVTVPAFAVSTIERTEKDEDGKEITKSVTIADIDAVADMLYDEGLIKYKWLFKLFCSFSNGAEKIRAGSYILKTDYDYRALIYGMNLKNGKRVEVDVTIPEGFTVRQIVELLDEKGVCDASDMWNSLRNDEFSYEFVSAEIPRADNALEGYLFPDTYTFYMGDTASRVIGKLLSNFSKKWTDEYSERAKELGYTQREIITIASLIEKEAGADAERATIASVIYNRLRDGGSGTNYYLQIDASLYYAAAEAGVEMSIDIDSPYNTYRNQGLTPGPIANPGLASIKAALNPESTKYYYYALGKDHVHHFFATLEEHTAFVHSDNYGG